MAGWHHQLNGPELEQTPGDAEGLGNLVCCSPMESQRADTVEWLNYSMLKVAGPTPAPLRPFPTTLPQPTQAGNPTLTETCQFLKVDKE